MAFSRTIRTPLSRIPAVDSGILPSALRANAHGVIQNRSRRFCRGICDVLSGNVVFELLPFSMACSQRKWRNIHVPPAACRKTLFFNSLLIPTLILALVVRSTAHLR
jgi:hypothetical protein